MVHKQTVIRIGGSLILAVSINSSTDSSVQRNFGIESELSLRHCLVSRSQMDISGLHGHLIDGGLFANMIFNGLNELIQRVNSAIAQNDFAEEALLNVDVARLKP